MSSKDNILFSDIFDIKDVDGAGKKFDKGNEQKISNKRPKHRKRIQFC